MAESHDRVPMKRTPLKRTSGPRRKPREAPPEDVRDRMAAFGALARVKGAKCAVCGHARRAELQVHHTVEKAALTLRGIDAWDPRWGLVVCCEPAPNRCHERHTLAVRRIPRSALRPENIAMAERHALLWMIERNYPEEGTA